MLNKRGALELSVNAIVIVVLAMTLLGLGLAFIRGQISKITETSEQVQDQIRDQILEDLRTGDKRLSFPSSEISIRSRNSKTIVIGVKNLLDRNLKFRIKIQDLNSDADGNPLDCGDTNHFYSKSTRTEGNRCAAFSWDSSEQSLQPGQANVYPIMLFAPLLKDTYLYKILIEDTEAPDDDNVYASKTFFVRVT
ncbi:hypothetical protein DRJ48_04365 [Candidatus Woesearchaeota archaeon]|nr:hypothetical protein [Candidatus Woesearchaeota archaeon]RLE42037.1 MAG: hypothetical protein DRJ48_04365 [Candidatus Woesearchaeota archaeon]